MLSGTATFTSSAGAGANDCNNILGSLSASGTALAPSAISGWKTSWPSFTPSFFYVTGLQTFDAGAPGGRIELYATGGSVMGSFAEAPGSATFTGELTQWKDSAILTACSTSTGLVSLPIDGGSAFL